MEKKEMLLECLEKQKENMEQVADIVKSIEEEPGLTGDQKDTLQSVYEVMSCDERKLKLIDFVMETYRFVMLEQHTREETDEYKRSLFRRMGKEFLF